jgi:hypothetical protein
LADAFLAAAVKALAPAAVRVEVLGLHGEDGGTGVEMRVVFLTGGSKAAAAWQKRLADFDEVEKIWPAEPFGRYAHSEAISHTCLAARDGADAPPAAGRTPSLQFSAALEDRSPEFVTDAVGLTFVGAVEAFFAPGALVLRACAALRLWHSFFLSGSDRAPFLLPPSLPPSLPPAPP